MFGQNPIRKQALDPQGRLWVQQVFATIQGEGPLAGTPAVFVRLAGCNLRCWFCDTDFESAFQDPSNFMTVYQVLEHIEQAAAPYTIGLVVLTGGEPMRQNVAPLIYCLQDIGWKVQIETAGTLWVPGLWPVDIVVSPKVRKVHPRIEEHAVAWKYILKAGRTSTEDGLPITSTQEQEKAATLCRPPPEAAVYVQPCDEQVPELNRANMRETIRVAMKHGYRISLQQHKILEVE